jgi:hypothetical protein
VASHDDHIHPMLLRLFRNHLTRAQPATYDHLKLPGFEFFALDEFGKVFPRFTLKQPIELSDRSLTSITPRRRNDVKQNDTSFFPLWRVSARNPGPPLTEVRNRQGLNRFGPSVHPSKLKSKMFRVTCAVSANYAAKQRNGNASRLEQLL